MGRRSRPVCATMVLCLFICSVLVYGDEVGHDHGQNPKEPAERSTISKILESMSPFSANSPATTMSSSTSYWDRLKAMLGQAQSFIFRPNLDFRGSSSEEVGRESGGVGGGGSAGEKVREAVAKSVEKSKAAVEGSSKTAAKLASETVEKAKEKAKRSLSAKGEL